ncbi:uncharacterized protein LOC132029393 isoform X2 [Lycium ferocissimum]|uniref:uncharacterized protein LOC132029393 isoform X2 n=1 Tax=Lycium ferocissimum TaxID=112874 RepID=UPI0028154749|nr:uncharacterized protein LOC132029393 isoform X2 [Lycium ferocissimum]
MGRKLSKAAKERWRKRKAAMEVSQNEGDQNIQRASLASENEADGPNNSGLPTDNEQSKHSQSAAFTSKGKVSKVNNMIVRRSNRLKSFGSFGKRQGKEAVHRVDLTDCDRDKEPHIEPIRDADGPNHSELTTNNEQSKHSQSTAVLSKRKTSKASDVLVRQSGQLKSLGSFGKRQGRGSVHRVDLTNCDRDTVLRVEPISSKPIRNMSSSETIVDHLVQTRGKRPFASETPTNLNYKILYTNSEKKIEALMEENYRQAQELHYVLGKVKIYENMIGLVMNLSGGAVKLHPDAAALNSTPAPKSSLVKKKKNSVKRMKKN